MFKANRTRCGGRSGYGKGHEIGFVKLGLKSRSLTEKKTERERGTKTEVCACLLVAQENVEERGHTGHKKKTYLLKPGSGRVQRLCNKLSTRVACKSSASITLYST